MHLLGEEKSIPFNKHFFIQSKLF